MRNGFKKWRFYLSAMILPVMLFTSCSSDDGNDPEPEEETKELVVDFTFTNEENSLEVVFTNTSENAESYEWNFGDGSPAVTEEHPIHVYDASGTYTVTLIGRDADGNVLNKKQSVEVSDGNEPIGEPGDVFDDFSGEERSANISWTADPGIDLIHGVDFEGDELDSLVGQYTRTAESQSHSKIFIRPLPADVNWNERTVFSLRVYFPSSNDYSGALNTEVGLKLRPDNEEGSGSDFTREVAVRKSVGEDRLDQWVTLEFDMTEAVRSDGSFDPSLDYTTFVVQLGGDAGAAEGTIYVKDFKRLD